MKKLVCALLLIAMVSSLFNISTFAESDEQFSDTVYKMGDVNVDGSVDPTDILAFSNVLSNQSRAYMNYELADLNGDSSCDLKDYLLLRQKVANIDVKTNERSFLKIDQDITNELEDLGLNNYYYNDDFYYDDRNYAYTVSRNPYDMMAVRDMVMVSGGNYQDNTGPVPICSYRRDIDTATSMGSLDTEQVNRFYQYDDLSLTLAIDPKDWCTSSIYYLGGKRNRWSTKRAVISNAIHCYDMAKHNGKYFLCGSAVSYDENYKAYNGENAELTKATVYLFTGSSLNLSKLGDYKEVDLVYKDGTKIDYLSNLVQKVAKENNTDHYYCYATGVPRIYDLYELNGELYALYYNQYSDLYKDEDKNYDFNGLYKYDEDKNQFIYDSELNIQPIIEKFDEQQDAEKIQHDFEWKGKHYFIMEGLFSTSDFKTYNDIKLTGYEDYNTHDAIVRSGKVYLLAGKENNDGTYSNVVLETENFKDFRPILHFSSKAFARSFEFNNGAFYFGLGAHLIRKNPGEYPAEYDINKECGRIYRYIYYK